jgi:hypothetical protein
MPISEKVNVEGAVFHRTPQPIATLQADIFTIGIFALTKLKGVVVLTLRFKLSASGTTPRC